MHGKLITCVIKQLDSVVIMNIKMMMVVMKVNKGKGAYVYLACCRSY